MGEYELEFPGAPGKGESDMDKEKILQWAFELIKLYEDNEERIVDEFGDASKDSHLQNKEFCDGLRTEIRELLELN